MRSVRPGPILLTSAVLFAATHVAGVLIGGTVWRYAEPAAGALLLACAVLCGPPKPRWALPAALTVLLADALRTLPADPGAAVGARYVLTPSGPESRGVTFALERALEACWAPLVAAVLLLIAFRRGGRPSRAVSATAAVVAALITGYAVVRVVAVASALRPGTSAPVSSSAGSESAAGVALAVLPAVALGLVAVALAALLAGVGRRLAAAGASLLAVAALPYIDGALAVVPLPYGAGVREGLFSGVLLTGTPAMPGLMPALTAALELTAVVLLVAGLAGALRRRPAMAR